MSVAQPLPHDAAALHVTGAARYVDDIPTPAGTLHLAFGLSPVARGALTGMDLSAVRAAPGVVAVLTADDLPFANDVSPSVHDEPLLATDRVHYVGQPLFLVVAALLIVMMAFRPDAAIVLANLMPSAGMIGWIIGIMAVGLFVVKFIRWRRDP